VCKEVGSLARGIRRAFLALIVAALVVLVFLVLAVPTPQPV